MATQAKKVDTASPLTRDGLVELLNQDLAREFQAVKKFLATQPGLAATIAAFP